MNFPFLDLNFFSNNSACEFSVRRRKSFNEQNYLDFPSPDCSKISTRVYEARLLTSQNLKHENPHNHKPQHNKVTATIAIPTHHSRIRSIISKVGCYSVMK
jgi:hypothetical protein